MDALTRARGAAVALATLVVACTNETADSYPHASEPIGSVREIYDGALSPARAVSTFRNTHRLFPTRTISAAPSPRPLLPAPRLVEQLAVPDGDSTVTLEQFARVNRAAALLVLDSGRVALERYWLGTRPDSRWMSMSIAKSVSSTLVGAALRDGAIRSLDDSVTRYVPSLRGSAYDGVTLRHLVQMTSGVAWTEAYTDSTSDRRRLLEAQIAQRPGGAMDVMRSLGRATPAGTAFRYSTGETQVVAEVLRGAAGVPLAEYLEQKVWRPAGMESRATWWLESPDGVEIGGSGLAATLRDYARFGDFVLNDGVVGGDSILPAHWMRDATTPLQLPSGRTVEFGYLWWTASTDAARRDRAFNAEGIHGQFIYVNPTARVVIVLLSARPHPTDGAAVSDYAFFDAVVEAVRANRGMLSAPVRDASLRR